jgi:hypothetical protein
VAIRSVYFDESPPYYILMQQVAGRDLASGCDSQGGIEQVPLETRLGYGTNVDAEGVRRTLSEARKGRKPSGSGFSPG